MLNSKPIIGAHPRRRILIADSYEDAAESLAAVLRALGHTVVIAANGTAALSAAADFVPDVVLMDIRLDGMCGYDVARRLRAQQAFNQALLVAYTGSTSSQDKARAADAGFDAFIMKPGTVETLLILRTRAVSGRAR